MHDFDTIIRLTIIGHLPHHENAWPILEFYALNASQTRRNAAIDALRAPCYALGITMAGFSTIAREAGFDFWMALVTVAWRLGDAGAGGFCQPIFGRRIFVYYFCRGIAGEYADVADGYFGG
jgi:hypothetical protein